MLDSVWDWNKIIHLCVFMTNVTNKKDRRDILICSPPELGNRDAEIDHSNSKPCNYRMTIVKQVGIPIWTSGFLPARNIIGHLSM